MRPYVFKATSRRTRSRPAPGRRAVGRRFLHRPPQPGLIIASRPGSTAQRPGRRLAAILVAASVFTLLAPANAGTIRLKSHASVSGPKVSLADVATLEGDPAERFADERVLAWSDETGDRATLSMGTIRQRLDEAGANWALLSLAGFSECEVRRVERAPESKPHADSSSSANAAAGETDRSAATLEAQLRNRMNASGALANPDGGLALESTQSSRTLRDRVLEALEIHTGRTADRLRVVFNERDRANLRRDAWGEGGRFLIEPINTATLGRVLLAIPHYRDQQLQDSAQLAAHVSLRTRAVTATRTIRRGQTIAPGDVEVRELHVEDDSLKPFETVSQVVGQRAATTLREGVILSRETVSPPVVIQRGQHVRVQAVTGGLAVQILARAREQGAVGDVIELRNERSHETLLARVTGPGEARVQEINARDHERNKQNKVARR